MKKFRVRLFTAVCLCVLVLLSSCGSKTSDVDIKSIFEIMYRGDDIASRELYKELETARTEKDFLYTVNDGEIVLNKYVGKSDEIIIPEQIEGKPVTTLGVYLVLCPNEYYMDNGAVYSDFVKRIKISSTVKYIYNGNFLANYLYDSETTDSKEIPLEYIEVDEKNPYYSSYQGVLYDKNKKRLLSIPYSYKESVLEVPKTVELITNSYCGVPDAVKTVKGCRGTVAEQFAYDNDLEFIALD